MVNVSGKYSPELTAHFGHLALNHKIVPPSSQTRFSYSRMILRDEIHFLLST